MKTFFKNIFFLIILNISLIANSQSASNIFYIDLDFVFQNSKIGKSIINELDLINKENKSKYDKIEEDLKQSEINLINSKNIISENEFNNKINELKIKIDSFLNEKKNAVNDYEKFRNKKINDFFSKINPIIEQFMKDNSIDILLEKKNIFISKSDYDISSQIIDKIEN